MLQEVFETLSTERFFGYVGVVIKFEDEAGKIPVLLGTGPTMAHRTIPRYHQTS
jgi:hypothetical protein